MCTCSQSSRPRYRACCALDPEYDSRHRISNPTPVASVRVHACCAEHKRRQGTSTIQANIARGKRPPHFPLAPFFVFVRESTSIESMHRFRPRVRFASSNFESNTCRLGTRMSIALLSPYPTTAVGRDELACGPRDSLHVPATRSDSIDHQFAVDLAERRRAHKLFLATVPQPQSGRPSPWNPGGFEWKRRMSKAVLQGTWSTTSYVHSTGTRWSKYPLVLDRCARASRYHGSIGPLAGYHFRRWADGQL